MKDENENCNSKKNLSQNWDLNKTIYECLANEAKGFYSSITTVTTAFLGGSLFFLRDITPGPQPPIVLAILFIGWFLLLLTLGLLVYIRRLNLTSMQNALENKWADAREVDKRGNRCTFFMLIAFFLGLLCLTVFGAFTFTFAKKIDERSSSMSKEDRPSGIPKKEPGYTEGQRKPADRTIPTGSLGPSEPKPTPKTGSGNQSGSNTTKKDN